jgi:hypothetical protein
MPGRLWPVIPKQLRQSKACLSQFSVSIGNSGARKWHMELVKGEAAKKRPIRVRRSPNSYQILKASACEQNFLKQVKSTFWCEDNLQSDHSMTMALKK